MTDLEKFDRLCERILLSDFPDGFCFSSMCRAEGLSETRADNLFYARFGLSGDEIVTQK